MAKSTKPISQREARALKRRVKELEAANTKLRKSMGGDTYPGRWLLQMPADTVAQSVARTAARLGYVLVARINSDGGTLNFYAVATETPNNV